MNFIRLFFIFSTVLTLLFTGLVISVDPYMKLGINVFGFKTKAVAQSRENKYYLYESSKKQYDAIIMGSSAAHRYPTSTVKNTINLETFNYAVQHSTPIDYLVILKHVLSKHRPKVIFLQIDFDALNQFYDVDNRLFNSPLKNFLASHETRTKPLFDHDYFTLAAIRDSLRVFYVNYFGKARHIYLEDGNYRKELPLKGKVKTRISSSKKYQISNERIEVLKEIQKICDKKQIELIAFSAPLSFEHLKIIKNTLSLKEKHQKFITHLDSVFRNFTNFQSLNKMKDYNSSEYFRDSTHPSLKMSEIILQQLLTSLKDKNNNESI